MGDLAIRVSGLGKRYRVGQQERYTALRDVLTEAGAAPFRWLRKPNRNGDSKDRFSPDQPAKKQTNNDFIWALDDVSFEVKQGEVVGVIGRNGAGKSTLLKILSRITKPTRGQAEVTGRVGSLLEVGTGFHPELTGRENIFLNGAILGMRKAEIDRQFDEIVAFAEIERFIDTPVKRYSTGMYMRLAFAIAAHLEPEILLVDEVLAVGDAAFQKKCLGKMGEVAGGGRTILFVSHNMAALRVLCTRCLVLRDGRLIQDTDSETAVQEYLAHETPLEAQTVWNSQNLPATSELRFLSAHILNDRNEPASVIDSRKPFCIAVEYEVLRPITGLRIGFSLRNSAGIAMCGSNDPDAWQKARRDPGHYVSRCMFPGYLLNAGRYSVCFAADAPPGHEPSIETPYCLSFSIEDIEGHGPFNERLPGVLRPKLNWEVTHNGQNPTG